MLFGRCKKLWRKTPQSRSHDSRSTSTNYIKQSSTTPIISLPVTYSATLSCRRHPPSKLQASSSSTQASLPIPSFYTIQHQHFNSQWWRHSVHPVRQHLCKHLSTRGKCARIVARLTAGWGSLTVSLYPWSRHLWDSTSARAHSSVSSPRATYRQPAHEFCSRAIGRGIAYRTTTAISQNLNPPSVTNTYLANLLYQLKRWPSRDTRGVGWHSGKVKIPLCCPFILQWPRATVSKYYIPEAGVLTILQLLLDPNDRPRIHNAGQLIGVGQGMFIRGSPNELTSTAAGARHHENATQDQNEVGCQKIHR